jgi:cytochrome P450
MTDVSPQTPHPILAEFNPYNPEQCRDPYPMYAHAREQAPIFFSPVLNMWVVTRHEDLVEIVHDTARFSNRRTINPLAQLPPEVVAVLATGFPQSRTGLVDSDPPAHTRVRQLVNKAFTPRSVAAMEPRIRSWVDTLVSAFSEVGHADLMKQFAYPLPRIVIAGVLGVPHADIDKFGQWADDWTLMLFTMGLPLAQQLKGAHSAVALQKYAESLITQRLVQPKDDLLTDMAHATLEDGSAFTTPELVGMVNSFLIAGHLTTSDMLGNALNLLMTHPEQWQALCRNPELAPKIIEEVLRRDSSVPGMMRVATEDITFKGVEISKGSRIFLAFSSGNHDEDVFPDPRHFDPGRDNLSQHLAFGQGVHYCVGAPLARMEGRIALEVLSQRLPNLRLQPNQTITYTPSLLFHGPDHLHLMWDSLV